MRFFLAAALFPIAAALLPAQTLSIYSGNGQIVEQLFQSPVPLVVQAKDANGKPVAGVPITWSSTPASNGTLVNMTNVTDANGLAMTSFLGTTNGSIGMSFLQSTVTAKSPASSVNFVLTISLSSSTVGGLGAPPLIQMLAPMPGATLTAPAGSTLTGAVKILVVAQSGDQAGQPIPNVGVIIPPPADPSQPSASCSGPAGTVLTNSSGIATCDLILGPATGLVAMSAEVGYISYTPTFFLKVTPAIACTYTVSPTSQSFGQGGGTSTVTVSSGTGCSWTAAANEAWLAITSATNGSGNGTVTYSVASDSGAARAGSLTIAGQTIAISQAGSTGPSPVAITTGATLPIAPTATAYSTLLTASGGTPPYRWSATSLPPGLTLNGMTGIISGTPTNTGTYTFPVTVMDSLNASATQSFTITVVTAGSGPVITNASFPPGVIGQVYSQALTSTLGCTTPFTPVPVFKVSAGMLPPGLSLQSASNSYTIGGTPTTAGTYNFTLVAQDACGNTGMASFTITVTTTAVPVLSSSPASLTFSTAFSSTSTLPSQTVSLTGTAGLAYTATASTATGGNWLSVTNPSGTIPGMLTITAGNTSKLSPGSYNGTITVTSPGVSTPLNIPVTLMVTAVSLNISPLNIAVTLPNTGQTVSQQSIVFTTGSVAVNYTAMANTGASGNWLTVTPTSGASPATLTATLNAAGLAPGVFNGSVQVGTPYGNLTVNVLLTVVSTDLLVAAPQKLSFTAAAGGTPVTQTVAITATGAAAPITLAASSSPAWLTVTPATGTTPVTASITANPAALTPGTYTGTVTVGGSAGVTSTAVPVSFTVTTPSAVPQILAVTNAASYIPGPVAPGELITIFGTGMGPASLTAAAVNSSGVIENMLAGTQVLFDGNPAPIVYTSAAQIAVIVPYEIASDASTMFQIVYKGVKSNQLNLKVVNASPSVFTLDAAGQGAILNQDTTTNSQANGAEAGSIVSIYATGAGQTSPPGVTGKLAVASALSMPVLPVTVSIGGEQAQVLYAGDSPGLASGVLQVNARVPRNLTSGTEVPVQLIVGSYTSPTVRMWIK